MDAKCVGRVSEYIEIIKEDQFTGWKVSKTPVRGFQKEEAVLKKCTNQPLGSCGAEGLYNYDARVGTVPKGAEMRRHGI